MIVALQKPFLNGDVDEMAVRGLLRISQLDGRARRDSNNVIRGIAYYVLRFLFGKTFLAVESDELPSRQPARKQCRLLRLRQTASN